MWLPRIAAVCCLVLVAGGCGNAVVNLRAASDATATPASELAQLWIDPGPVPRDLFWGSGGPKYAPPPEATFTLKARDDTGFSVSYDVTSPDETEWSAKIGPEAQTEVVVSRLMWGLGYHQPPIYYLPSWSLDRGRADRRRESEARFRPKLPALERAQECLALGRQSVSRRPRVQRHARRAADVEQHRLEG